MTPTSNPFEPPEQARDVAQFAQRPDASIIWFTISVAIFLTASNAFFATNGIWYTLLEEPIRGAGSIAFFAGLCTLVYAPFSKLLRKLCGYRYTVFIGLFSGLFFAVGDRFMRFFQAETGINYFLLNILICLAFTIPPELFIGLLSRLITGTTRSQPNTKD